jgi:hypothetical protein
MTTNPCLYPPHPVFSLSDAYALADKLFGNWTYVYINGSGVCTVEIFEGFDADHHRLFETIRDFCQIHLSDDLDDQDDDDDCCYDPDEGSIYHGCW